MPLLLCILLATTLVICAQKPESEAALAAQLADKIRRGTKPLGSTLVQEYVERVGRGLAAFLTGPSVAFVYTVVIDGIGGRTHEPRSLAGQVVIPAGLILAAQDEAEFAGMVAHAMAHAADDPRLLRLEPAGSRTIPLVFIGGGDGQILPAAFLPRQRELEKRADAMAVKMTSAAGYDPEALARYIRRMQPDDTERSRKSSPLPPRDTRIAALYEVIQQLPQKTYPASRDFAGIQDEVRRVLRPVESDRPPTLRRPGENQP